MVLNFYALLALFVVGFAVVLYRLAPDPRQPGHATLAVCLSVLNKKTDRLLNVRRRESEWMTVSPSFHPVSAVFAKHQIHSHT